MNSQKSPMDKATDKSTEKSTDNAMDKSMEKSIENAIERVRHLACWKGLTHIEALEGGITNINLKVTDAGHDYVVRLGEDIPEHGVMRFNELAISRAAQMAGISPPVHHVEKGIMVLGFVGGTALSDKDLHDVDTLTDVTLLMRQVHTGLPGCLRGPVLAFWVFHVLRDYTAYLHEHQSSHKAVLSELARQAAQLEAAVGKIELVLGHNDLLPANILRGQDRYWLIDWEYGGFNSPLFDLGGLASNADLPPELESHMLEIYLGHEPDADFLRRYTAMKCASLLRETLWSMVSEISSRIDFDYTVYTADNLARYRQAYADTQSSRGTT